MGPESQCGSAGLEFEAPEGTRSHPPSPKNYSAAKKYFNTHSKKKRTAAKKALPHSLYPRPDIRYRVLEAPGATPLRPLVYRNRVLF
ncbi:hypothetical protein GWI33_019694 [Rhynchophorus ferrugineus]|uniref:Uncharacterized protein n=1 Tax=Rhynchophorus ferrugineus TaxID=354439 RepID=A0A834HVN8_RHYFE|nr:hypothetical protein GWI33_019694 [Rhynchophorus ferrugineus]